MLVHSSGSTGTPKGAIMPERIVQSSWDPGRPGAGRAVCFAPMNHLVGRARCSPRWRVAARLLHLQAGPVIPVRGHPADPTDRAAVFPRVLEMIHRHYLGEVVRRTGRRRRRRRDRRARR